MMFRNLTTTKYKNNMKRIIHINILLIFFTFFVEAAIDPPKIELKGNNFKVGTIDNGKQLFLNRAYVFENTCSDILGWQFTQINGKGVSESTFSGTDIELKASSDGYIYALVGDVATEDSITSAWASVEGWEVYSNCTMNYNDHDKTKLKLYCKECRKDEWINIVQPKIFSGAIICAPVIESPSTVIAPPPGVVIHD